MSKGKKKKGKKVIIIILIVVVVLFLLLLLLGSSDDEVGEMTYTGTTEETSADVRSESKNFTLMVYMCGSNLETENGCATIDLTEMMYANIGDNINIIVETGGAYEWQNDLISSDALERYRVTNDGLEFLGDAGNKSITDTDELTDFVKFAAATYPADRYGIIFWDHGGGTMGGYGGDENFDGAAMPINDIKRGLENAGTHFEFVGFDCCLMGTVEIASALSDISNYLIASEESEPGTGWYYTNFISLIEEDPGVSMLDIGKQIINDYTSPEYTDTWCELTLSLIDLSKIGKVLDSLYSYMSASDKYLINDGYNDISMARYNAKSYGDNGFEQIDIVSYIDQINIDGGSDVKAAIDAVVLYNGTNTRNSNGLAMYFPYLAPELYGEVSSITAEVGVDNKDYIEFFNNFMSVETGGQVSGGNSNPYMASSETGNTIAGSISEDWYNESIVDNYTEDYTYVDSDYLEITEKDGEYVLELSDEDWSIVTEINLQVYIDDGEGFLSLGSDNVFDYNDYGDLKVEFDYVWLYINDCIVPFMSTERGAFLNGDEYFDGYVSALLNDNDYIKIWLRWIGEDVTVLGYTFDGDSSLAQRGYSQFNDGDVIDFLFEYYDYNGNYLDDYTLEDNSFVYNSSVGLTPCYQEFEECNTQVLFYLRDIYQNEYWTEPLTYDFN